MANTHNCMIVSSEGKEFCVSKHQLETNSDFFKALFNSGMQESKSNQINLPTISSDSVELLIKFIENEEIPETLESVITVLDGCTYLQMAKLTSFCSGVLINVLSDTNCFRVYDLAEDYMMFDVKEKVIEFMADNFVGISKTPDFRECSVETLLGLLENDSLLCSESELFQAVTDWLTINKKTEELHLVNDVFGSVRFTLMSENELDTCIQALYSNGIEKNFRVWTSIETAKKCLSKPQLVLTKNFELNAASRRTETCILTVGGFTKSNNATSRMMIVPKKHLLEANCEVTWKSHPNSKACLKLPRPLCEHCLALVGVFVFCAGGQKHYCQDGRHTSKDVYRLDTRTCKWTQVSSMETPRSLFYMGVLDNHLYAVGGWVKPDTVSRSVECYDVVKDKWQQLSHMDIGLHEHAGTTHKGNLYVSGGFKGPYRGHLDQAWRYDLNCDNWTELARMSYSRSYHCMVSTGEQILVAGGVNYIGNEIFQDVKACEMYDPESDQWTTISHVPRYASCMSYLILHHKVYIFGGHSFEEDTDHSYVQIYDLSTNEWTEKLMENTNISFFNCVETSIPKTITSMFTV